MLGEPPARRAGGNPFFHVPLPEVMPLFVEEMTQAVLESSVLKPGREQVTLVGSVSALAIPATLHDSLMARLDRLMTAKVVAQLGATIGRTFSYELLQTVAEIDAPALQTELRRLVEAELLYQRGLVPQATYTFKHALIQDAAYQSLLKSTRQQVHERIAPGPPLLPPPAVAARPRRWRRPQHAAVACRSGAQQGVARQCAAWACGAG